MRYETARDVLDPGVPLRILFSAHGLPEVYRSRGGDPVSIPNRTDVAVLIAAWRRNDL